MTKDQELDVVELGVASIETQGIQGVGDELGGKQRDFGISDID